MTSNLLTSLGNVPTTAPALFAATTTQNPLMVATHTKPAGLLHIHRPRPSEKSDPVVRQRAGSLIEGMCAAAFTLDHTVRQISYMGVVKQGAKQQLTITLAHIEKLTAALMTQFEARDVDYFNSISGDLAKCIEAFCALDEGQKDAALRHMQGMQQANLTYLPPLTAYSQDDSH